MWIRVLVSILIPICLADVRLTEPRSWDAWKRTHNKTYNLIHEENRRKEIWQANADHVRQHNLRYNMGLETYYTGLNQFSDLTWDEFKAKYLAPVPMEMNRHGEKTNFASLTRSTLPKFVDWRKKGYVTSVKSQGPCQSSWAFAAIGAVESQYAMNAHELVNMSVQQLIDCSRDFGNDGCNSGWMENAYRYMNIHSILDDADYPYSAKQNEKCQQNHPKGIAKVKSYYAVHSGDEVLLKELIARFGPAAVAINVDEGFMSYAGGIYKSYTCKRNDPNYGLLVVGYENRYTQNFWIVKTSLGESFGMDGYINLAQDEDNMCGIANYASVPMLKRA